MWLAFFLLSIFFILAPITAKCIFKKLKGRKFFYTTFSAIFLSVTLLIIPIKLSAASSDALSVIAAILIGFQNAIQIFSADFDFEIIESGVIYSPIWLQGVYKLWAALHVSIAPLFTFGFVLSFFKNFFAHAAYTLTLFKDVYAFSELNEKALALAKDIRKNKKHAAIVFTDVFENNSEESYELVQEATNIGAICFRKDILAIAFGLLHRKKITFFTIGICENENVNQALRLIEKYKDRPKTDLYIFSTKADGDLLLNSSDKGVMKVRRINEVLSLVNRHLYENGNVIFESARPSPTEDTKIISAIILGMGGHGTEFLKALTWYAQMDGYSLKINAFDKDPLAEEKFISSAPELMAKKYNGAKIKGEPFYEIKIHSGIDVETISFTNEIGKIKDATYVIVALGNDDVNISASVNLRTCFERMKINPIIQTIIYNSKQKRALNDLHNFKNQAYNIDFIGDIDSSYSEDTIINSSLENDALNRHLSYVKAVIGNNNLEAENFNRILSESGLLQRTGLTLEEIKERQTFSFSKKQPPLTDKEREALDILSSYWNKKDAETQAFWKYEYNYRSSVASAIHKKARIFCKIPGADKDKQQRTQEELDILKDLEHRRWSAYMRAFGYVYSQSDDPKSRNDLGKMHHNLAPTERLDYNDAEKDSV